MCENKLEDILKHLTSLLMTLFLVLSPAPSHAETSSEDTAVLNTFRGYKDAVLSGSGERAVNFVAKKTLDYYAELKDLALYGRAEQVKSLTLMDRLMIISLRHRIQPAALKAMSPKELFVYAVQNGWIGKDNVRRLDIDAVVISENSAKAAYRYDGQTVDLFFHFYKEDEGWKLDLLSVLRTGDAALQEALRSQGRDENEFIFTAIESVTGTPLPEGIWQPPFPTRD
jgi:hypothetical protein